MPRPGTPLSPFALEDAPPAALVSFRSGQLHGRGELAQRVASLTGWIEKSGRGRWLLQCEDAFASAVALLALVQARSCAVVAPNSQPETLRRLCDGVQGALAESGSELPGLGPRPRLWPLDAAGPPELRAPASSRSAIAAEFQTSGTTGPEKSVPKQRRHLEDEVALLEALFGARVGAETAFFATVSPQHIYGLLFRVLWPLASGRPFQAETLLLPQELVPRMRERSPCALVTTPSHLQRMAAGRGLGALAGHCRAIFSSGAPLDAATRDAVASALGVAPIEILGSTETGGIAWREGEALWTPFPGVEITRAEEGRLAVHSPLASVGEAGGAGRRRFVTGDLCELNGDGRFELHGRADRVVKIAGKRLALGAMEAELAQHAWVSEAALVATLRGSELRVHAAVVPSEAGREALRAGGHSALREACTGHLASRFDRVLLPRAWRFVAALPRSAAGKLPATALRALFERPREPILHQELREPGALLCLLEVPEDLAQLEGHFEGRPVVPGVAILGWALRAAGELAGRELAVLCIDALKFPEPLLPGQRCWLRASVSEDRRRLDFELRDATRVFASGRCTLAEGNPA